MDLQQRSRKNSAKAGSNNNAFGQLIPQDRLTICIYGERNELVQKQVRSRVIKNDTKIMTRLWGNT